MKKENATYEPKWLSWKDIKNTKKYQGKYLILGCNKNGLLLEVESDVIYASVSNEKVKNYWLKNKEKIKDLKTQEKSKNINKMFILAEKINIYGNLRFTLPKYIL